MSDHPREAERHAKRLINICDDVWYDVFGWSTHDELGLKLAPLCRRFDRLAGVNLVSKKRRWTLGSIVYRWNGNCAQLNGVLLKKSAVMHVPPPSNLVGFTQIRIHHVDQNVIAFLHRISHLFNNVDITLKLPLQFCVWRTELLRTLFCTHLWPLIAQRVYKLVNFGLLRTLCSPAILRDCANLRVIHADCGFPETPADDHEDASDGQALNKWLHTPRSDGLPKVVTCNSYRIIGATGLAGLKTTFVSAELPVSYIICVMPQQLFHQGPFKVENQRTRERMTFQRSFDGPAADKCVWLLKRGPTNWWDENKWAESERKAKKEAFGHWSDENNLIYCHENMTFD